MRGAIVAALVAAGCGSSGPFASSGTWYPSGLECDGTPLAIVGVEASSLSFSSERTYDQDSLASGCGRHVAGAQVDEDGALAFGGTESCDPSPCTQVVFITDGSTQVEQDLGCPSTPVIGVTLHFEGGDNSLAVVEDEPGHQCRTTYSR